MDNPECSVNNHAVWQTLNVRQRIQAVRQFGKLGDADKVSFLYDVLCTDKNSRVRREAVSAIGRMRLESSIPLLIQLLEDTDPSIICQAIRALLCFKGQAAIDDVLMRLQQHENETVRSTIRKAYLHTSISNSSIPSDDVLTKLRNLVVKTDVRDALKLIPDETFHLTFTSPPYYNARDYAIYPSYEAYLLFLDEVFREVHRTTKEGRFLVVNTSPVIVPRVSRAHQSKRYPIPFDLHGYLVRMGWDFIDDIVWEKPEYSVKNRIGGFQQHRKPLAYKPNTVTEYLMVYRKHTDKLIDWNMRQYDAETIQNSIVEEGYETTNIWRISPKSDKIHSAVFPAELCKRVIAYYSYKGDLVFDPFAGSGTLGKTAKHMDRCFFLTERDETYFNYMKLCKRETGLFDDRQSRFLSFDQFKELME